MARRVVVTGGSGGIGRAIADVFVAAGDDVVITGRDADRLQSVVVSLAGGPGTVTAVTGDLSDAEAAGAVVHAAVARLGGIDVLINNAGVAPISPLLGGPESDDAWETALTLNLTAPWRMIRAALPYLPDGGRIVSIGAMTGRIRAAHCGAFAASKQGLVGLTRSLALDLAPRRITVNAVAPAWVDSALADQTFAAMADHAGTLIGVIRDAAVTGSSLGRLVATTDVAQLVLFLASAAAGGITAQVYGVDSGQGAVS